MYPTYIATTFTYIPLLPRDALVHHNHRDFKEAIVHPSCKLFLEYFVTKRELAQKNKKKK